jgi:hypothetical protein
MALLQNNEFARRENGRIELRSAPMRVRWNLDDLVTGDGHKLHCAFTASVSALSDATERRMLEEVFLGGRAEAVTVEAVVGHFLPALRAAAGKAACKRSAAEWVEGEHRQEMVDPLKDAARAVAFTSGLEVVPPYDVMLESPTHKSQKIEEMERTLVERRVAGQVEHFERASRLLKQFQELRAAAPELSAGDVLKQVGAADQGLMLQTLLLAAGKSQQNLCLWAVAGGALVKIDGRATPATLEQVAMPSALGPLRSVQPARLDGVDVLLVGARAGVIAFDPKTRETREYADPSIQSPLGFSKAVVWNGQIWGCHGEAGIVGWKVNEPGTPAVVTRPTELRTGDNPPPLPTPQQQTVGPAASPGSIVMSSPAATGIGNLTPIDENRLALSVGRALVVLDPTGKPTAVEGAVRPAAIVGVFVDGNRVVVVDAAGGVSQRDRGTLKVLSDHRPTGAVKAASLLPWLGSNRLLLATEQGPVYCVGLDDDLVTTYSSGHRELRIVAASPDLLAAVSADRQRVVLWNSWDGKKPLAELNVASATKHRVGDIEFA